MSIPADPLDVTPSDVELTAREELEEVAALLHDADIQEKEAKEMKEQIRPAFFDLISEVVREEIPLARKVETVEMDDNFDPEKWREFNYPAWRIIAIEANQDGTATITLEENENLVKFEFEVGGYKFGRQIRMEGKDFKSEAFYAKVHAAKLDGVSREAREALAKVVTKEMVPVYSVDEDEALRVMTEYPDTVALFQQFMFPGTPKPALMPIKKVKDKTK